MVQTPNLVRETCFLFDLHTLSIISLLLSFYISITNITCKPETWSTFLDHTLSSVQSLGRVWLFVTQWTVALQAPLSMVILQARRVEWVAMSHLQGIIPTQGSNLGFCMQADSLPAEPPGNLIIGCPRQFAYCSSSCISSDCDFDIRIAQLHTTWRRNRSTRHYATLFRRS